MNVVFSVMVGVSVGQVVDAEVVRPVTLFVITHEAMRSLLASKVTVGVSVTELPETTETELDARVSVGTTMSIGVTVTVTYLVVVSVEGRTVLGS